MPKKGANRKPQTCLTQKTAKPSPSISNLHPPFSTRSLWIKGQTFRVKMEDLLCQPAGRDAKAFGEMPRWPCWVFVRKNTAPPLCHPSLSAKHCGFALHDIQDEHPKQRPCCMSSSDFPMIRLLTLTTRTSCVFCSRTAELVWIYSWTNWSLLHSLLQQVQQAHWILVSQEPKHESGIESRKICCSAIYGQAWHPPFLIFTILAWSVPKGKTLQMENTEIKNTKPRKYAVYLLFDIYRINDTSTIDKIQNPF